MNFFIIFIMIPFAELMVFAAVSERIGIMTALFFALLTAVIGGALVRHQGLQTLFSVRAQIDRGTLPLSALFDGLCLVAAGALLITPGFITDFIGFSLLVPQIRNILRHIIKTRTNWAVYATETGHHQQRRSAHDPDVIEAEFEDITSRHDD